MPHQNEGVIADSHAKAMNENKVKIFTLEEASELLPVLSERLEELKTKREEIAQTEVQIDAAELIKNSNDPSSAEELSALVEKHQELVGEFYAAVDDIQSYGCFLKDVDMGLIDFCGLVDGRMVYWCWRLGEEEIRFWHEMSQGYTMRKTLEEI